MTKQEMSSPGIQKMFCYGLAREFLTALSFLGANVKIKEIS